MVTLEQLSQFLAAAENLSFSRAAEQLYISHSTVSRSVSSIEKQLGVELFNRSRSGIKLTKAGLELAERAAQLLSLEKEMESAVKEVGGNVEQRVTVASVNIFCQSVYKVYHDFREENPGCRLDISSVQSGAVLGAVRSGADVGLAFSYEIEGEEDLVSREVERGEFCLLTADGSAMARKDSVYISEIERSTSIMLRGLSVRMLENIHRGIPSPAKDVIMADSAEELVMIVKAGLGVAILPEHVARTAGPGCRAVGLTGADTAYSIVMFMKKNSTNRNAKKLMEMLE